MVKKIADKFQLNLDRDCERQKFINFLQSLQDAHDGVFDEFSNNDTEEKRISYFVGKCDQIASEYGIA